MMMSTYVSMSAAQLDRRHPKNGALTMDRRIIQILLTPVRRYHPVLEVGGGLVNSGLLFWRER